MKPVFQFRDGSQLHGDAQAAGERLHAIKASKSALTPELVLADASAKRSPLHAYFEWDDTEAAQKYRLAQAGHLIRSVVVTFEEVEPPSERQVSLQGVAAAPLSPARPVRAFLPIRDEEGQSSYVPTQEAMADGDMRRQVLERAHAEMAAVGRKYRELQELSGVFQALDQVAEQLREPTAA